MTTITDEDEHLMDMDENLQLRQKHLLPIQQEENENKRMKLAQWFSDLDDDQLLEIFGEGLRFEIYRGRLTQQLFGRLKLFGTIQVAPVETFPDPLNRFYVFNHEFNDPEPLASTDEIQDLAYISLPVSSTSIFRIAAELYLASDTVDDTVNLSDDYDRKPGASVDPVDELTMQTLDSWFTQELLISDNEAECSDNEAEDFINNEVKDFINNEVKDFINNEVKDFCNEAFHCCDDHGHIDFSEFSDKPNGGPGSCKLQGKDGSLELYYVAVKYAVDADLEVKFSITSKETKISGCVFALFGEGFYHGKSYNPWQVLLFEPTSASVTPGNINLMRSVLAVPAKSSLIIMADLYGSTSSETILCDLCEFRVPLDCASSKKILLGQGCSLELKVNWKQPCKELKIPSANFISHLTERRTFGAHATPTTADPDERKRWSLQEEIAKVFNTSLKQTFKIEEAVPCSISTCTKEDGGDYVCSSVLYKWPEIKNTGLYKGPKHAGLAVKDNIMACDYKDMMERCVVCGPGFVKFKFSRTWIAKSIHTMLTVGIDAWAPKISVKRAFIICTLHNIADEMNMGHSRPYFIGQTLACLLDYSGVDVVQKTIRLTKDKSFCESYTLGDELPVVLTDESSGFCLEEDEAKLVVNVYDFGPRESIQLAEYCNAIWWGIYASNRLRFCFVERDDFERFRADKLVDLLDEAKSRCKALLVGQGMADEWTAADLENAAVALESDALKYAHLKCNRLTTGHTFSYDQMLNEEGNTVAYLHYTHARICSVIRNSNKDVKESTVESLILKHDDERELGLHLLRFTEVLGEVFIFLAPHILCDYLYGLCKMFNGLDSFVSKVVGSSEETSKLLLCKVAEMVMRKCFNLLGITPIYKI